MKKKILCAFISAVIAVNALSVSAFAEYKTVNGVFCNVENNVSTPYSGYVQLGNGILGYYHNGLPYTGWITDDGELGCYSTGVPLSGWVKSGNNYFYFSKNGTAYTGEHYVSGGVYNFLSNGAWDGQLPKNFAFSLDYRDTSGDNMYIQYNNANYYLLPNETPTENDIANAVYIGSVTKTVHHNGEIKNNFETIALPEGTQLYLEKSGTIIAANKNTFFGDRLLSRFSTDKAKSLLQYNNPVMQVYVSDPPAGAYHINFGTILSNWISYDRERYQKNGAIHLDRVTAEFVKTLPYLGEVGTTLKWNSSLVTNDLQSTFAPVGSKVYKYGDKVIVIYKQADTGNGIEYAMMCKKVER